MTSLAVNQISSVLLGAIKAGSLMAVAMHFVLTLVYVLPANPLKLELAQLLSATVAVYAPQNWSLFAPNPIASDQAMLAKCLTASDRDSTKDQKTTSGWRDVSLPFWLKFQENRFTAYDRLVRPQTNALRAYTSGGLLLAPWKAVCETKRDPHACKVYEAGLTAAREAAGRMLRRIGSAFCKDVAPDAPIVAVALRARYTSALPWSRRGDRESSRRTQDVDLGVFPIERRIQSTALFVPDVRR